MLQLLFFSLEAMEPWYQGGTILNYLILPFASWKMILS